MGTIRHILQIFCSDAKKICTNWAALIIAGGLIVLPSLYAWVNIWACWDPYGNTGGVKVGIVNEDEGGELAGVEISIGSEVLSSLRENKSLGWTFYDTRDDGVDRVKQGDVYATIIIPNDFSSKMCTLLDDNPVKPRLEYYVNEKINAIAPKMTDKGVSTIQQQISTSFIETAVEKVFDIFNEVGVKVDQDLPNIERYKNLLLSVSDRLPDANVHLDSLLTKAKNGMVKIDQNQDDAAAVIDILSTISDVSGELSGDLGSLNSELGGLSNNVRENLLLAKSTFSSMSARLDALSRSVREQKPDAVESIDNALADAGRAKRQISSALNDLNSLNSSADISAVSQTLQNNLESLQTHLSSLRSHLGDASEVKQLTNNIRSVLRDIRGNLSDLEHAADTAIGKAEDNLNEVQNLLLTISGFLDSLPLNESGTVDQDTAARLAEELHSKAGSLAGSSLLRGVASQAGSLASALNGLAQNGAVSNLVQNARAAVNGLYAGIDSAKLQLRSFRSSFDDRLEAISSLLRFTDSVLGDAGSMVQDTAQNTQQDLGRLVRDAGKVRSWLSDNTSALSDRQDAASQNILSLNDSLLRRFDRLSSLLNELKDGVTNHNDVSETLSELSALMDSASELFDQSALRLDESLIPKLEKYLLRSSALTGDLSILTNDLSDDVVKIREFISAATEKGEVSVDQITDLKNRLPDLSGKLSRISTTLRTMDETVSLKELVKLMLKDGSTTGDFFASPVQIDTHVLFHIENYGAGLTPFYTVLSLWVGALLLCALLSTKSKNVDFQFTAREEYFGKYLLFGTMAVLQSLIDTLGALFVLHVTVANPILFVLLGVFYSIVFSMIVFTLVSIFGNVGKAMAVVLLVFQLAGTGGTFPIQVTPPFFQALYSKLPFTYAISGMREAIGGVVYEVLLRDIFMLIIYFVIFLILGALLKKPINRLLRGAAKKFSSSGVVDH